MKSHEFINETTTAGGVATVVGGLGPAITRDASIYGNKKPGKKKKKKSGKYSNSITEGASAIGYGEINSMEFWDQVTNELNNHPAITSAELEDAESFGDTDSGWRYIKFVIDFRDEYIHFDMDMRWGDNADGTYGKPLQHWTFTGYPDGNVLKDEKYRAEVYENPKDEAHKIINTLMDI